MSDFIQTVRRPVAGAAAALLRGKGAALLDILRRWRMRRAALRDLDALLHAEERILRDIGVTRREVHAALDRLRGAPVTWDAPTLRRLN